MTAVTRDGGEARLLKRVPVSAAVSECFPVSDLSSPWVGGCAGEEPGDVPEGSRDA